MSNDICDILRTMETEKKESLWDTIKFLAIALAIVIPIRIFIAQPFIVSGDSMVPTFHNHDYLIVDQLSYHIGHPQRGDVIVFKYPYDTKRFFIKRVIGLPNETVVFKGNKITIVNEANPKGVVLNEPYINHDTQTTQTVHLKSDEYFVMGDNRPASSDSRVWGPLKEKFIDGRVLVRLFPFNKIDELPGEHRNQFNEDFNIDTKAEVKK